ncbi:MAG: hypothetical protein LBD55_03300 [Treponema sp.]|jgi:DnaJ-class molecular chaperone|nr:hypothetical protein [Treponema sp.]
MASFIESGIIIAAVALAAAFMMLRIAKTLRSKQPACSCCSGSGGTAKKTGKPCPHCAATNKI